MDASKIKKIPAYAGEEFGDYRAYKFSSSLPGLGGLGTPIIFLQIMQILFPSSIYFQMWTLHSSGLLRFDVGGFVV
jgi:hypothetical protein